MSAKKDRTIRKVALVTGYPTRAFKRAWAAVPRKLRGRLAIRWALVVAGKARLVRQRPPTPAELLALKAGRSIPARREPVSMTEPS